MRALYDRGVEWAFVQVEHDWSHLSEGEFWEKMKGSGTKRKRTHFYLRDETGRLRSHRDLPKSLAGLKDDPYRSMVYFLTKLGILEKDHEDYPLYGEFEVVKFLRPRVDVRTKSGRLRFDAALEEAAYILTDKENQDADLPGQIPMSPKKCALALEDIGDWD